MIRPARQIAFLLFLFSTPLLAATDPRCSPTQWVSQDGVKIRGLYCTPTSRARHVWILLHGLGSNKEEWLDFSQAALAAGQAVLFYDARGHGQSSVSSDGAELSYRTFNTIGPGSQWSKMTSDLGDAVHYLQTQKHIATHSIDLGGASLGANIALEYAAAHQEVPAIFLLSPGLEYAGIRGDLAMASYGSRPILLAASPGDSYSTQSVGALVQTYCGLGHCEVLQGEGAAHGVNMLKNPTTQKLITWMKETR